MATNESATLAAKELAATTTRLPELGLYVAFPQDLRWWEPFNYLGKFLGEVRCRTCRGDQSERRDFRQWKIREDGPASAPDHEEKEKCAKTVNVVPFSRTRAKSWNQDQCA